jgi:YgiT-type zinc finger domain-containing protein
MKCTTCRQAETREGTTTVTVERGGTMLVMQGVPALICPNCGEDYVGEDIARRIAKAAAEVADKGIKVEVRQYAA